MLATARRKSENPSVDVTEAFTTFFNASQPTANHVSIRPIAVSRTCASSGGFFFDAVNSAQLMAAFDAIGRQLVALRLKH